MCLPRAAICGICMLGRERWRLELSNRMSTEEKEGGGGGTTILVFTVILYLWPYPPQARWKSRYTKLPLKQQCSVLLLKRKEKLPTFALHILRLRLPPLFPLYYCVYQPLSSWLPFTSGSRHVNK